MDFLRPHIRQATNARAPRTIAPPTPPTTPPIIFFELSLRFELPPPSPLFRLGVEVTVAKPVVFARTSWEDVVEVYCSPLLLVPTTVLTTLEVCLLTSGLVKVTFRVRALDASAPDSVLMLPDLSVEVMTRFGPCGLPVGPPRPLRDPPPDVGEESSAVVVVADESPGDAVEEPCGWGSVDALVVGDGLSGDDEGPFGELVEEVTSGKGGRADESSSLDGEEVEDELVSSVEVGVAEEEGVLDGVVSPPDEPVPNATPCRFCMIWSRLSAEARRATRTQSKAPKRGKEYLGIIMDC